MEFVLNHILYFVILWYIFIPLQRPVSIGNLYLLSLKQISAVIHACLTLLFQRYIMMLLRGNGPDEKTDQELEVCNCLGFHCPFTCVWYLRYKNIIKPFFADIVSLPLIKVHSGDRLHYCDPNSYLLDLNWMCGKSSGWCVWGGGGRGSVGGGCSFKLLCDWNLSNSRNQWIWI